MLTNAISTPLFALPNSKYNLKQTFNFALTPNSTETLRLKLKVNFEIYIADRKATTCI